MVNGVPTSPGLAFDVSPEPAGVFLIVVRGQNSFFGLLWNLLEGHILCAPLLGAGDRGCFRNLFHAHL
jgi:hypothetical protein